MKIIKHLTFMAAIATISLATISCKEKKQNDDIIIAKYVPEKLKEPIRLSTDVRSSEVNWLGKKYTIEVQRVPADSLPKVKDENGQLYVDNRVTMKITRDDKSVFLRRSFVKESFSTYVDHDFQKSGYLENIVFHSIDNNQLKFGVVITSAGNEDEFVPLDMWIDRQGGIMIKPGKLFDSNEDPDSI